MLGLYNSLQVATERTCIGPSRRPSVQAVLYYPQRYGSQLDGTSLLAHKTYKEEGRWAFEEMNVCVFGVVAFD